MDYLQSINSTPIKAPLLVRIPGIQKKEKEKENRKLSIPLLKVDILEKEKENRELSIPLLKVDISNRSRNTETTIFRIPAEYYAKQLNNQYVKKTEPSVPPSIPKLIDIRSVLQDRRNVVNSVSTKNHIVHRDIKLIELPLIKNETHLLDSPKRKASDVTKQKHVEKEAPQIIDIRPFTPQEPLNLIDTEKIERKPRNRRRAERSRNSPQRTRSNPKKYSEPQTDGNDNSPQRTRRNPKKHSAPETDGNDTATEELDNRSRKKLRSKKKDAEDDLYEVISELMMRRRKKKRKKGIKLFDIIDAIPLTTDSESDDNVLIHEKERVNRRRQIDLLDEQNANIRLLHPEVTKSTTWLPNVPATTPKPLNTNDHLYSEYGLSPSIDRFKPKSLRPLSHEDALSWANIIKTARQETQGTQTERRSTINVKSEEVQTEMKEMIEIPRSQTFFSSQTDSDKTVRQTNEFCNRVREDVVEKLANIKKVESKFCQTVCHAGMQTDDEVEEMRVCVDKVMDTGNQKSTKYPEEKSCVSFLPPDIQTSVNISITREKVKHEFINIVDLDRPLESMSNSASQDVENVNKGTKESGFFKLESINDYVSRKVTERNAEEEKMKNIVLEKESIAVTYPTSPEGKRYTLHQSSDYVEEEVNLQSKHLESEIDQSLFDVGPSGDEDLNKKFGDQRDEKQILPDGLSTYALPKKKRGKKSKRTPKGSQGTESTGKVKLQNNISEFTVGLDALIDIHDNLEKELKQSKFLFGMIETLQDGFNSNASEDGEDSHSSRNYSDVYCSPGGSQQFVTEAMPNDFNTLEFDEDLSKTNIIHAAEEPLDDDYLGLELIDASYKSAGFTGDLINEIPQQNSMKPDDWIHESNMGTEEVLDVGGSANLFYNRSTKQIAKVETEKEKLFKEELKQRICKTRTSEENKRKLEEDRKAKLQKWIKSKKRERHSEYLAERVQKREAEHRPFVSKTIPGNKLKENMSIIADVKRCVLEENNQERLLDAEILASSIISKKQPFTDEHTNNRYRKTHALPNPEKIPIRETRASKIRKTALVAGVIKQQQLQQSLTKRKGRRRKEAPHKENMNKKTKSVRGNSKKVIDMNTSLNKSFDFTSPKRSVEAHNFVTRDSYDDYLVKSSLLVEKSMREYKHADTNGLLGDESFLRRSTSTRLSDASFHPQATKTIPMKSKNLKSGEKKQQDFSVNSSAENAEVAKVLQKYGMNGDLFEKVSGTSQLLAEVDLALLEDSDVQSEISIVSGKIDWDEVDKILGE